MKIKNPSEPARACIIWMHGLGSGAEDMMGLANQLPLSFPVRHVCLDAPIRPVTCNNYMSMRAWYDITGFKLTDRQDQAGIEASECLIHEVIEQQISLGFSASQIFLAGFSQGGAMALFTGLRTRHKLGGIISLSAYLPLADVLKPILDKKTPIFIGYGSLDQVVLPTWTMNSVEWLRAHQFERVDVYDYSMEHSVCFEEICTMAHWITSGISTLTSTLED